MSSPTSSSLSSASSSPLRYNLPHLSCHAYGQRASKASDIAQLLDPSYSPTRTAYTDNHIYVDHAGEAHDPDFRLFAQYSPKRRFVAEIDEDDDDEEVEDEGVSLYSVRRADRRRTSFESYPRPSSRASSSVSTPAHDSDFTFSYSYTNGTSFTEEPEEYYDEEPRRETKKLRRRRSDPEPETFVPEPQSSEQEQVWTPTTKHILRTQWHALCLRTQVAAFRARRRVTRAVSKSGG